MPNTEQLAKDLSRMAVNSALPPADRAKAMTLAAVRLREMASDDPVELLVGEMLSWARTMAPAPDQDARTYYAALGTGVDLAAIELEGQISGDARLTREATIGILQGRTHDLSGISEIGAKPFVDALTADIGDLDADEAKALAGNALLRSLAPLDRHSMLGSDDMLCGMVHRLVRAGMPPRLLDDDAMNRVARAVRI